MNLKLREIQLKDLEEYSILNHPDRKFHNLNWPYFKRKSESELLEFIKEIKTRLLKWEWNVLEDRELIVDKNNGELIWEVNWYWKSEETLWMEIWIVIFNEDYWGKGIWYTAMKIWINELFQERKDIIRLWLTTWSWNKAMIWLTEKLGFKKEAVYRKARIVDEKYYDSVSYWILREEWLELDYNL